MREVTRCNAKRECMKLILMILVSLIFINGCSIKGKEMADETNVSKPCIAVLQGIFNEGGKDTPEFKEYSKRSNANGEANGGVVLSKYMISENLGQGDMPHFVIVVSYPSREIAVDTFTNDEYNAIIPLRDVAFKEVKILISDQYDR